MPDLFFPFGSKTNEIYNNNFVLTFSLLVMHLRACIMSRMISTVVSIHIHLESPSSQTKSSSISSLTKMLMASMRETDLSMDDIEELIGMQSYAVLLNKISVIKDLRFYCMINSLPICLSIGCSEDTRLIINLIRCP